MSRITILLPLLLLAAVPAPFAWAGPGQVANGSMNGPATDRSEGKGQFLTPPGWLPVNVNAGRGDRLSLEPSDRPGAGTCLHIKCFGGDAGVYQTIAPLEAGKSYVVTAWVKRLSGTLAIGAYPHAWGPAVMRVIDADSTGWTRLAVGLTAVDAGAHLYLVSWPAAEFLIDDVEIHPAPLQVSAPQLAPYDFSGQWHYQVRLTPVADAGPAPHTVQAEVVSDSLANHPYAPPQTVALRADGPTDCRLAVPVSAEGGYTVRFTDAASGEVVGASLVAPLAGQPWIIRYPYKLGLYASLQYQWPLRVGLQQAAQQDVAKLKLTATLADASGRALRQFGGKPVAGQLQALLDGRKLPTGTYRLQVKVSDAAGRRLLREERPLRVLTPGKQEVVCSPSGDTLVQGRRFFPLGLYWVLAVPEGWRPGPGRRTADMQALRQAGFNTLHTYAFEHNDANDTDDNALAYLDFAQELGFKVMMGLRRDWYQGKDLNAAAIRQRVARLREHPALLCWTLWDEPDGNLTNVPRVQAVYDLVNELDPYHPAMPVFMSAGGRPFRAATDVNLFDCYPGAGHAGVLPGVLARAQAALPDKPIWYVAQAYRQGDKVPSLEDMRRFGTYALDAHAKAIFWYSYGGDARGWDSIRCDDQHYANVLTAVRELADSVGGRH